MLGLAIEAGIPIIRVTTSDVLNVGRVIEHLCQQGDESLSVEQWSGPSRTFAADVFYAVGEVPVDGELYDRLVKANKVLVLVNQGEDCPYAFNAGEVPVPQALIVSLLKNVVTDKNIPELLPAFKGLTIKTAAEVIRLGFTEHKKLTPRVVMSMRSQIVGSLPGLQQADTHLPVYLPAKEVVEWIELNREYFLTNTNPELAPRGVLLNGAPGVGKSQGAKFIANEFGVPLYRLDLSSTLSKWRGESEQNLSRALATLDQEDGAVLLVDEAEKVFDTEKDEGGTGRLLSQLLWWLSEHRSRVLTVITTNNMAKLPPELYRPGRIDLTITLPLLSYTEACQLAGKVWVHLTRGVMNSATANPVYAAVKKAMAGKKSISHAAVTHAVQNLVKHQKKNAKK